MADSSRASRRVRVAGIAVLAIGCIVAAVVFLVAASPGEADLVAQQREMYEVARLGGTATVQTVKFDLWLSSLWHGTRLAETLAILSMFIAAACFYIAGLMDEQVDAPPPR